MKGLAVFLAQFHASGRMEEFIARHPIEATSVAFDDFAGAESDAQRNRKVLGLES